MDWAIALSSSRWEKDMAITSNYESWKQICINTVRVSQPSLQLILYKVLHRTHFTGLGLPTIL